MVPLGLHGLTMTGGPEDPGVTSGKEQDLLFFIRGDAGLGPSLQTLGDARHLQG